MRLLQARFARRILMPVQEFIRTEASGGAVLLAGTLVALVWANSPWDESYHDLWDTVITVDGGVFHISQDLRHWVNDGLMAIFFFVVGLEIKREALHGALAGPRRAAMPVAAALGGMAVPALLFAALNAGGAGARGWGIPMATDIAFSLGALALLGPRVPPQVRVFLLALAVVDDIGAILVIALFYSGGVEWDSLGIAGAIAAAILVLQWARITGTGFYIIAGTALWIAVLESGVHATIAGVALGLLTPSRPVIPRWQLRGAAKELAAELRQAAAAESEEEAEALLGDVEKVTAGAEAPLDRFERLLHPWSSFLVVPIFALANAGIDVSGAAVKDAVTSAVTWGVVLGLVVGKVTGITGATLLATRLRLGHLPRGMTLAHLAGIGLLAGIGFTVSLFITGLAFDHPELARDAKMGVFAASIIAGVAGYLFFCLAVRPQAALRMDEG